MTYVYIYIYCNTYIHTYICPQMVYFDGVSIPSRCRSNLTPGRGLPRPTSKPSCRAARAARLACYTTRAPVYDRETIGKP